MARSSVSRLGMHTKVESLGKVSTGPPQRLEANRLLNCVNALFGSGLRSWYPKVYQSQSSVGKVWLQHEKTIGVPMTPPLPIWMLLTTTPPNKVFTSVLKLLPRVNRGCVLRTLPRMACEAMLAKPGLLELIPQWLPNESSGALVSLCRPSDGASVVAIIRWSTAAQ